jgi:K+-transporting ATPase ATPase C chain
MFKQLVPAFKMTALLTVVTGLLYPGVVTGVCQVLFRDKADGSLIVRNGEVRGSTLLGQNFAKPEYFHTRPSAAGSDGYDPTASSGSNYGPTNQKLFDRMKASSEQFRKENPDYQGTIPADAITASGSGLDPDISIANAEAQAARVAKARGVAADQIEQLIAARTESRDLGLLGEPRVNAVTLNLQLDRQFSKPVKDSR